VRSSDDSSGMPPARSLTWSDRFPAPPRYRGVCESGVRQGAPAGAARRGSEWVGCRVRGGTVAFGLSSLERPKQGRGGDTRLTADAQHAIRELFATNQVVSFALAKPNACGGACDIACPLVRTFRCRVSIRGWRPLHRPVGGGDLLRARSTLGAWDHFAQHLLVSPASASRPRCSGARSARLCPAHLPPAPPAVVPADPPCSPVRHPGPGAVRFVGQEAVAELRVVTVRVEQRVRASDTPPLAWHRSPAVPASGSRAVWRASVPGTQP
jgi:hypothetical protein